MPDHANDYVTQVDRRLYFREAGWYGAVIGGLAPEVEVRDENGNVQNLYECNACAALTTSPDSHIMWHKTLFRGGDDRG